MQINFRHTIILIGCLFLCGCSKKNTLQVITKNFESEIELQENLLFTFNKDIFPDSLLNVWDSTSYIEFSPSVRGMFKFYAANELAFSPAEGFQPGCEYTGRLTKKLLIHNNKNYAVDDEPIKFHTAPLRITGTHLLWTRSKNMSDLMVQLDMSFNYEVNLGDAANKLKLNINGTHVSIAAVNSGNGKTLSLQFKPVNDKDDEIPLKIELNKGIPVRGSKYISDKDTSFTTTIPSRYNLSITDVSAQHTGSEGVISVSTSQPVLENNLKSLITLEPTVPFEVRLNEGGFTITGKEISVSQIYQLNISSKLEGAFGGKMKEEYTSQVSFGKLKPSVSFISKKGMYLSPAGYKNLAVNIINVPAVEVYVIKVYENNLEHFMRHDKAYDYHYDRSEEESVSYEYYETENLGDTIFHKSYETAKLPRQNSAYTLHLDFQDRIKDYNGVYVICVRSKEHNWIQESKILSVSDIGLIVKEEKDNIYVFANSIRNATPVQDAKISFISTNNQNLYTTTTDGEGVAVFKKTNSQGAAFKVGMVTARKNDEFTFVWFEKTKIGTSRFDVGGRMPNETGMIAMIYPERNLYRPGEAMHINTILRDEQWNTQSDIPVKIKLTMPNGKEFATIRKLLDEQGSCETTFSPPPTTMTGTYTIEVYTGNDVLLNSYKIIVEEFMPDRMKVDLKLNSNEFKPGESVSALVQADNLFGTPAAGRNYQCELNMNKGTFSSEKFPDHIFDLKNDFTFNTENRNGKTDDKGAVNETFKLDAATTNAGLINGNIMATVFDETGRPVHRYAHFLLWTQNTFAGIKCNEQYISSRQPVSLGLIVLDKKSNPQNTDVQVVIIKKEWHTVLQKDGNTYRYVSQSEERTILQQKTRVNGANTQFIFTPQQSGEYEVRVFTPGSNNYVSKTLYAYGWNDTQYTSFEVNNEGSVEIKTDKKEYNIGENANVLFTTPFEGKLLVTLERDHLLKHYSLDTKNKSASLSFKTDDSHLPNVYVTATLIRAMDGTDLPLTVAHGFKSVTVVNKNNELPVTISVAERSRSKTKQTITVKTSPGTFLTVAAVDEGILQVKNFTTPDPYNYFYQKVALSVNSFDIYPWLLPEIRNTLSSTGGDGSENSNMRLNPMFVNRVKNVSFWSGIKQADGNGVVKYDIDIPQFSGDIRVMALCYKNKAFGSSEQHIKVADPIVISTALPRFLSPKDEVVMPVSLSNTTSKNATAVITVKVSGPLELKDAETQTIQIPANRENRVVFNLDASQATGAGKVTITVNALGENFVNETEIGVRAPASLQKLTGSGLAAENATTPIDLKNSFIPASVSGKLVVAKSPLTQFAKHLDDLVQYPYGCVEQTTSAAFPQLYYADLVKSMNGITDKELNPAYNIQQAINKLQSMQLEDGGLSYWPQGGAESWWGSVYACHFLIEAGKAGYDVNTHVLDRLREYMKYKLFKKEILTFFYNNHQKKDVAPEEVPYSLYVLALAGQSQQATMNYYKAHRELLTLDGKYLLAAAYALSGQLTQAKEVLPFAFTGEIPDHCFTGSFYSYIRDEALSLNVLMDIDPNNSQVGIMSKQLSEQLAREHYLTTQENVFSILALGKIAKMTNNTNSTATITAGGKNIGNTTGQPLTIDMKNYSSGPLSLQVKGKGGYYYFWEADGITTDGTFKQEDNFLKVRRAYFDKNGNEMGTIFHQNDLVVVRITIEAEYDGTIENVAITDMLPAGLEIENTRLNEMPKMPWIKEQAEPDYRDIRDERINMFTSVNRKPKSFYYMVRAVSPGIYQLGPVQADAMYDGNYHSYNGAGVVRILDK